MKNIKKSKILKATILLFWIIAITSCTTKKKSEKEKLGTDLSQDNKTTVTYSSYGNDTAFMKEHTVILELTDASRESKIAISPALQARVMTSSAKGPNGRSYGWINRALFNSKDTLKNINVYGGEERFWLGPEGGQYSLFFKKGTAFTLDNWFTPRLIDVEPFELKNSSTTKAVFTKNARLTNYAGFEFDFGIEREIMILSANEISNELGIDTLGTAKAVAYKTTNIVTNTGQQDWKKETGLLSIWLLGMFNPSPKTTIVIPYIPGEENELGKVVNDNYFGKVPGERLVVKDKVIYFSGDGAYRSKIGLSPRRAKNSAGSYDTENGILTILKYNKPEGVTSYVNSMWEIQDQPYAGDVINSYNDGVPSLGEKPLGPFYELETSSPALALKTGETGTHIQYTFHIEGDELTLNPIIKKVFGVSIKDIKNAFN
ncbi:hypothetical protein MWU65_14095 [Cellulophaga sp. F20128]|uniref:DUF6786 family protein n=1 Tax=Cellulophaga sp. F20128 TaxID=2926413 RepID=UPI001FF5B059|nr:DUF6786 family protein [Cellulophaga sp. F20128]MCK0158323.1 hypothetical protein [Cellulophaga sp. F20128]